MSIGVAVAILAGGEGKRLGGDKPLRELSGERLIDHGVRLARQWSEIAAISVRGPAQVQPVAAPVLIDEPDIEGPLGGLISALRFAEARECDFLLTMPADMPFLPDDLLDRLTGAIGERGCALAASGGHVHPVCGLWRTASLECARGYAAGGSRSLKGLAAAIGSAEVEWPL